MLVHCLKRERSEGIEKKMKEKNKRHFEIADGVASITFNQFIQLSERVRSKPLINRHPSN